MSVSCLFVRAIVEALEQRGIERGAILSQGPIDARRLDDTSARFELDEFADFQVRALDLSKDDALGLHMGEQVTEAAFDHIAHLVSHATTMREAMSLCSQFQRLAMDGVRLDLTERTGVATIELAFPRTNPRADRMMAEFAMAGVSRMVRIFGGPQAKVESVSFEHPKPPHEREYTRIFGSVERFGQGSTALLFAAEVLDRPQLHRNPALQSALLSQAQSELDRLTNGVSHAGRLEEYLSGRAPSRMPDMETAARDLGISVRSLRRRLTEEGVSYRALVQAALERKATQMLRDPSRSVQETAHALGFADPTAFHRAFKRWTGVTPVEYRQGKLAG